MKLSTLNDARMLGIADAKAGEVRADAVVLATLKVGTDATKAQTDLALTYYAKGVALVAGRASASVTITNRASVVAR